MSAAGLATFIYLHLPVSERAWEDAALGAAPIVVDVAEESTDGFGPLKAILEAIATVYTGFEVRLQPMLVTPP